jgi:hypothetical protein
MIVAKTLCLTSGCSLVREFRKMNGLCAIGYHIGNPGHRVSSATTMAVTIRWESLLSETSQRVSALPDLPL